MKLSVIKPRNAIAALAFLLIGFAIVRIAPSVEVAWVSAFLLLTIYLFAFEVVSVDVAAITIMVLLGLTVELAPFMGLRQGLVSAHELFDGFASNAVISIIAVMIIGAGLDKTGIMSKVAGFILRLGGATETRIIPIISGTVGIISSFMQNVGAAALFLPVVSRISARTGLPLSRLLMPMGFTAILGGTMTMVGSSPLILLNDLIHTSNQALPEIHRMQPWELFAVTPIGLALVTTGILYFVLVGRMVLPASTGPASQAGDAVDYFRQVYGLDYEMAELAVPEDSELVGKSVDEVEALARVRIIAIAHQRGEMRIGPNSLSREVSVGAGSVLGVMADPLELEAFALQFGLARRAEPEAFAEALANTRAGVAELVIPPGSQLIGKSARELWLRKRYGLALLALHRGKQTLREGDAIRDLPLEAGDTLVGHIPWEALAHLEKDRNFVVVTTEYPHEEMRPHKVIWAMVFFSVALFMVLFTEVRLSVALMTGALGMILSGVLNIEEAYKAVSWKTVFLLASLIPLGMAVEASGTAKWIAESSLSVIGHMPTWVIQTAVAILATFFTLVMSNVGATVLLVPLAVNIAIGVDANPAVFALTVAIATSNSFLIPTHQVNALIMGPAGYRVPDFMRAGGIMTVLFLVVSIGMLNIVF